MGSFWWWILLKKNIPSRKFELIHPWEKWSKVSLTHFGPTKPFFFFFFFSFFYVWLLSHVIILQRVVGFLIAWKCCLFKSNRSGRNLLRFYSYFDVDNLVGFQVSSCNDPCQSFEIWIWHLMTLIFPWQYCQVIYSSLLRVKTITTDQHESFQHVFSPLTWFFDTLGGIKFHRAALSSTSIKGS